jgi:two-component system, OmpR family, KDP operon response regulator KdpE
MTALRVLIVDDEAEIRRFLRTALGSEGFEVLEADSGQRALADAAGKHPDAMILDLGLPDIDGVQVVQRLREWSRMPVIVLSARLMEEQKIAALDAGADDYVTKPFGVGELLARLRVALRHAAARGSGREQDTFTSGDLKVDLARREVFVRGERVHLTPIEYQLLAVLIQYAGKVVTHRELLKRVWGPSKIDQAHYLRIYMAQLRQKLEVDPAQPRLLETEAGVGYRLVWKADT